MKKQTIKLFRITCSGRVKRRVLRKGYWELTDYYWVKLYTSEGVYYAKMAPGWVTDGRSGSSAADICIPKWGSELYDALIMFHDLSYSGHVPRDIADELLRQGLELLGYGKRAEVAYYAVRAFGGLGYYDLEDDMKDPYTKNRDLEHFELGAE